MVDEPVGNWGRWGEDDQRGTLNLVTPDAVRRGLASVERGVVVSLSMPLKARSLPVYPGRSALVHMMTVDGGDYEAGAKRAENGFQFADDYLAMPSHTGTHVDALSHVGRAGSMYNRHPTKSVRSATGARALGIEHFRGLTTRAALLDVAAVVGQGALPNDFEIGVEHLELALGDLELLAGDAVLIRTGWLEQHDPGNSDWYTAEPGLGVDAARWLAAKDVSMIGADNFAIELVPARDGAMMPVHLICLQEYGIHLMELVDLSALAESGVRACLLVVAPLAIVGGVGSPVNPIAVY